MVLGNWSGSGGREYFTFFLNIIVVVSDVFPSKATGGLV